MRTAIVLRRREVLRLLGALAAAGATGLGGAGRAGATPSPERLAAARLRLRLARPESASLLGAAYLREHPAEASIDHLAAALGLSAGRAADAAPREATDEAVVLAIAERHRDDLRSGRVCRLDGFAFSRTELRLCALLHLADRT